MSTERILIHGTTAQRLAVTPELGQIGSDDDTKRVVVGDGTTPGGIEMARLSEVNRAAVGSNIASAGTLNLDNVDGSIVTVTGTTTTTAITLAAGRTMLVRAAAAWPITVGADLVLDNGGQNYTCAAGDEILFMSEGTTVRGFIFPISGTKANGAVAKATPVDADVLGFWDSVSAGIRKMTFANLKTWLNGLYATLTGATMTGDLAISKATPEFILNKPASGTGATIRGKTNNLERWAMVLGTADAEAGANAGSNFGLYAFDDAGAYLSNPLYINRASGLITLGAGQLLFPATQNPSSNANTLDDYEEGTWTPSITFGGAAVGLTYSARSASYVKIGKLCHVTWRTLMSAKGSSTGQARVEGLPFFNDGPTPTTLGIGLTQNFSGLTGILVLWEDAGANTSVRFFQSTATGNVGTVTDTIFTATTIVSGSGTYMAAT